MRKLIIAGLFASTVFAAAAQSTFAHHNGGERNVWQGPRPEFCLEVYEPVHDRHGNTYANSCYAAREGVRVTWAGEGS